MTGYIYIYIQDFSGLLRGAVKSWSKWHSANVLALVFVRYQFEDGGGGDIDEFGVDDDHNAGNHDDAEDVVALYVDDDEDDDDAAVDEVDADAAADLEGEHDDAFDDDVGAAEGDDDDEENVDDAAVDIHRQIYTDRWIIANNM